MVGLWSYTFPLWNSWILILVINELFFFFWFFVPHIILFSFFNSQNKQIRTKSSRPYFNSTCAFRNFSLFLQINLFFFFLYSVFFLLEIFLPFKELMCFFLILKNWNEMVKKLLIINQPWLFTWNELRTFTINSKEAKEEKKKRLAWPSHIYIHTNLFGWNNI